MDKTLIVLIGPTAVGKTDLSIEIAKYFGAPIVSSDSRQIYKEMNIGTAVPTPEQLLAVPHHFIQTRSITDDYTAGKYEKDAIKAITELHNSHQYIVLSGGSGLYIDAVCKGIDAIPEVNIETRTELEQKLKTEGLESLTKMLYNLDKKFYDEADLNNPKRVLRAVEVCLTSGKPYSELRIGKGKKRNFKIIMVGLSIDRDILYQRINQRVDIMVNEGLIEEVEKLHPFKHYNALQTVGYKELFDYFENKITKEQAIELIKRDTRRYAKRQMTWFRQYENIKWFSPTNFNDIISYILASK